MAETNENENPIQSIFNSLITISNASEILRNPYKCSQVIKSLNHMNNVSLNHLGLDRSYISRINYGECVTITSTPLFDIAAFILPKGFTLQLHDHPNMIVCTKLLMGTMSIRSFSKVSCVNDENVISKLSLDTIKSSEDDAWLLTPQDGNYHEITPITDCVMLDVLLPPYDDHDRSCNFYTAKLLQDNTWLLHLLPDHLQDRIRLPMNVHYQGYRPILCCNNNTNNTTINTNTNVTTQSV